jgi:ketosteroid isomerase-like protein
MNTEETLERLLAYEEIRQLVYRYAVAVDARDIDTIAELFVEDVQAAPDKVGRDALKEAYEGLLDPEGVSILNVGNHVIDFDDADHARGIVYCRAELETGDQWIVQAITYRDRYERHGGRWYFRGRQHLLFYGADMLQRPIGLPPAEKPEYGTGKGSMPEIWPTFRAYRQRHRPG